VCLPVDTFAKRSIASGLKTGVGEIVSRLKGKCLADAVDLIVGLALRKCQQFGFKHRQESRVSGKKHKTSSEFALIDIEPTNLVVLNAHKFHHAAERDLFEFLGERGAGGSVLDQHVVRLISLSEPESGPLQCRVVITPACDIDQIVIILYKHPGRTHRPIIQDSIFGGGVPRS